MLYAHHTFEPWNEQRTRAICADHAQTKGALLPLLHALQHAFGYVPDDAVPIVAEALNISRADVHGVITFYHDFRREPAGRHVLKLCRSEACQARGAARTIATLEAKLEVTLGATTRDGRVTVEPIYCLGLCASGPAALLNGEPLARLEGPRLDALVARLSA
jgi:formate dehydrogenase subunit gamma